MDEYYGTFFESPVGNPFRLAIYYNKDTNIYTVFDNFTDPACVIGTRFDTLREARAYAKTLKPLYEAWCEGEIAIYDEDSYDIDDYERDFDKVFH